MEIFTRVILLPPGGGEPLESFDRAEDPRTAAIDTILENCTQKVGTNHDVRRTAPHRLDPVD